MADAGEGGGAQRIDDVEGEEEVQSRRMDEIKKGR